MPRSAFEGGRRPRDGGLRVHRERVVVLAVVVVAVGGWVVGLAELLYKPGRLTSTHALNSGSLSPREADTVLAKRRGRRRGRRRNTLSRSGTTSRDVDVMVGIWNGRARGGWVKQTGWGGFRSRWGGGCWFGSGLSIYIPVSSLPSSCSHSHSHSLSFSFCLDR